MTSLNPRTIKNPKPLKKPVSVYLDEDLHAFVSHQAKALATTESQYVKYLITITNHEWRKMTFTQANASLPYLMPPTPTPPSDKLPNHD